MTSSQTSRSASPQPARSDSENPLPYITRIIGGHRRRGLAPPRPHGFCRWPRRSIGTVPVTSIDVRLRGAREDALRSLLDAQNRRDVDAAVACFAKPRYELIATRRVFDGPEAVRRYLAASMATFSDLRFETHTVHHAADAVVAELTMSGTHTGDRPGVPATGRSFRCPMAAIFAFEGTDLVGARLYYDTGTIARQLA